MSVDKVVPFFAVKDMEQSVAFYVDGLGFEFENKWVEDGALRWCHLRIGGAGLMLQQFRTEGHDARRFSDDEGEGFFMSSLKSDRRELRLASALGLGKLGLRSAVVPLINALCEHQEPDWKIEAEVLSRLGVAAIRTVEQFLRNPRGCEDRLVFLASALASTKCNKQVKDLADERDPMVASLAKQAVTMKPRVKAEIEGLLTGETDDPMVLFVRAMDSRLSGG